MKFSPNLGNSGINCQLKFIDALNASNPISLVFKVVPLKMLVDLICAWFPSLMVGYLFKYPDSIL